VFLRKWALIKKAEIKNYIPIRKKVEINQTKSIKMKVRGCKLRNAVKW
jgi:hypothetical protein